MCEAILEKKGIYELKTIEYSFFGAFVRGVSKVKEEIVKYYKGFTKMINPETGAYKYNLAT